MSSLVLLTRRTFAGLLCSLALTTSALPAAATPATDPGSRLRDAATRGDLAALQALLDAGADVNAASEYGATALALAADRGQPEAVKILLEHGARVGAVDSFYNSTPILWAAYNGHTEVVKLLLAAGADSGPAVAMAVERNQPEVIRVVLDSGRVKPESLAGVLVGARTAGKAAIVTLLEAAGVPPPPAAAGGIDPAILARYAGRYESDQFHYIRGEDVYLEISAAEGALRVSFLGQPPMALTAVDDTHFRLSTFAAVTLSFLAKDGKVVGLEVDQAGTKLTARRVEAAGGARASSSEP